MLLNEKEGVAAIKYDTVINEIFEYVKKQIHYYITNNRLLINDKQPITIPHEITDKIDFITPYNEENSCGLTVMITPYILSTRRDELVFGDGEANEYFDEELTDDGKLSFGRITLKLFLSEYGDIFQKTFYGTMYHELNHLYEAYEQIKSIQQKDKNQNLSDTKYGSHDIERKYHGIIGDIKNILTKTCNQQYVDGICSIFHSILYSLWSDTELNAIVSSTFGDLKSLNSTIDKSNEDIKKTAAYHIYLNINDELQYVNKMSDDIIEKIILVFKKYGIKIGNKPETFRYNFIKITENKLKVLYHKLIRSSGLYYNTLEDKNNIINEQNEQRKNGSYKIFGMLIDVYSPTEILENYNRLSGLLK